MASDLVSFRSIVSHPGLRKKILLTVALVILYQALAHIPLPGIDPAILKQSTQAASGAGALLVFLNLFSGGGLANLSILAVGLNAYLSAGTLVQTVIKLSPSLSTRMRETPGEGERQARLWTAILTVPLGLYYAYALIWLLSGACWSRPILPHFGFSINGVFTLTILAILTGGACLAMWLARWIERDGLSIGGGTDILLLGGIAAGLPGELIQAATGKAPAWIGVPIYLLLLLIGIVVLVYVAGATRKIPIAIPQRNTGLTATQSFIPLPLSIGKRGMLAGQSLINLAVLLANLFVCSSTASARQVAAAIPTALSEGSLLVGLLLFLPAVLFIYFYAFDGFDPAEIADQLRKDRRGAFIPGIRPGKTTQEYLAKLLRRLMPLPALILGLVVIFPWLVNRLTGLSFSIADGDNLLILVATVSDSLLLMQAEVQMNSYAGFIRKR